MAILPSYSDRDFDLIPYFIFAFAEQCIKSNNKSSGDIFINTGFIYYPSLILISVSNSFPERYGLVNKQTINQPFFKVVVNSMNGRSSIL